MSDIDRSTKIMASMIILVVATWTLLEWLGIHVPFGA